MQICKSKIFSPAIVTQPINVDNFTVMIPYSGLDPDKISQVFTAMCDKHNRTLEDLLKPIVESHKITQTHYLVYMCIALILCVIVILTCIIVWIKRNCVMITESNVEKNDNSQKTEASAPVERKLSYQHLAQSSNSI